VELGSKKAWKAFGIFIGLLILLGVYARLTDRRPQWQKDRDARIGVTQPNTRPKPKGPRTCEQAHVGLRDASADVANWSQRVEHAVGDDQARCAEELATAERAYKVASAAVDRLCK
jgi:hypothetical protein